MGKCGILVGDLGRLMGDRGGSGDSLGDPGSNDCLGDLIGIGAGCLGEPVCSGLGDPGRDGTLGDPGSC